jgi:hypothetical protein
MSYDQIRDLLARCRHRQNATGELVEALEALANAVESDLAEIKAALSQLAPDDDRASSRPRRS